MGLGQRFLVMRSHEGARGVVCKQIQRYRAMQISLGVEDHTEQGSQRGLGTSAFLGYGARSVRKLLERKKTSSGFKSWQ